jgi:hypothetical protein
MPLPLAKSVILVSVRISGLGAPSILDDTTVNTIAQAIQQQEGYYPGSLAYTNNNPGNLIYAGQSGAVPGSGGFAKFPDYTTGYQALLNQIQLYASRGMTIQDMMNVYAPAGQGSNDPTVYAMAIANAVGASPSTPLTDLGSLSTVDPGSFVASLNPSSPGFSPGALGFVVIGGLFGILLLSR